MQEGWGAVVDLRSYVFLDSLQPQMAALKAEGLVEGSGVAARFGVLHGIASLLYFANSVIGMVLLVMMGLPRRESLRAGG